MELPWNPWAAALALCVVGCGTRVIEPIAADREGAGGTSAADAGAGNVGGGAGSDALTRDLVAYWKLDETDGADDAVDAVGGHTGSPVGAPQPSSDIPGVMFADPGSRTFNGLSQYLLIPNADDLNFSGEITLAAWVKLAALNDDCQYIVGHGYCWDPPGEVVLRVGSPTCGPGGAPHYWAAGSWLMAEHSAIFALDDSDVGVWEHIAGTYVDGAWHLYRNGQEVGTQSSDVGAVPVQSDWAIGARAPGSPPCMPAPVERFLNGAIDDVRIYHRALSAAEIEELYHR